MKNIIKILYTITLFFLFLPAFAFPLFDRTFRVYFIFLLVFFCIYIFLCPLKFVKKLILLYKRTPFKYLIYFVLFLYISALIITIFNFRDGIRSIVYLIQLVFLYIIPTYLLSAYFISKEYRLKSFLKFYFAALFSIFLFGLIEFTFGKLLNIEFINTIQRFIANERHINKDYVFTLYRLSSVFAEPGWLCGFVFLNFPIIYSCCNSKYKIYKNKYVNKIIKTTLIPLAWINVIFSMSPIWLVFTIIQALYIFKNRIIKSIFNVNTFLILHIIICTLTIGLITAFFIFDISLIIPQISRITITIFNLFNFEALIDAEQSLGTRLVCYYTQIKIFLSNFLIGVGLNNAQYYATNTIIQYNIPMTPENYVCFKDSFADERMHINTAVLYTLLAESGIIGTFLYYILIYKSYKVVKKYIKFLNESLLKDFTKGFLMSLFFYTLMTFYDTLLATPYNWFFLGISSSIAILYRHTILAIKTQKPMEGEPVG